MATLKKYPVVVTLNEVTVVVEKRIQTPDEIERKADTVKSNNLDLASFFQLRNIAEELQKQGKLPNTGDEAAEDPSLVAAIIENIQINISKVHVRYEDPTSHPSRPFAVGVTLEQFATASSADDTTHSSISCRRASLSNFSMYWDQLSSKEDKFTQCSSAQYVHKGMLAGIPTSKEPKSHNYILEPTTQEAFLYRNAQLVQGYPKLRVVAKLNAPSFKLVRDQYIDAIFLQIWVSLHQHRPKLRIKDSPSKGGKSKLLLQWWNYFCRCTVNQAQHVSSEAGDEQKKLEDDDESFASAQEELHSNSTPASSPSPRKNPPKESQGKLKRNRMKEYIDAYKELIRKERELLMKGEDVGNVYDSVYVSRSPGIKELENVFSYRQLVTFRSIAMVQVDKEEMKKAGSTKKSWWFFGGSADNSAYTLNPDEMSALYELVDIKIDESTASHSSFEALRMNFGLTDCSASLMLPKHGSTPESDVTLKFSADAEISQKSKSSDISFGVTKFEISHSLPDEQAFPQALYLKDKSDNSVANFSMSQHEKDLNIKANVNPIRVVVCPKLAQEAIAFFAFKPAQVMKEQILGRIYSLNTGQIDVAELMKNRPTISASISVSAPEVLIPFDFDDTESDSILLSFGKVEVLSDAKQQQKLSDELKSWLNTKSGNHRVSDVGGAFDRWNVTVSQISASLEGMGKTLSGNSIPILHPVNASILCLMSALPSSELPLQAAADITLPLLKVSYCNSLLRHLARSLSRLNQLTKGLGMREKEDMQGLSSEFMWSLRLDDSATMKRKQSVASVESIYVGIDSSREQEVESSPSLAVRINMQEVAASVYGLQELHDLPNGEYSSAGLFEHCSQESIFSFRHSLSQSSSTAELTMALENLSVCCDLAQHGVLVASTLGGTHITDNTMPEKWSKLFKTSESCDSATGNSKSASSIAMKVLNSGETDLDVKFSTLNVRWNDESMRMVLGSCGMLLKILGIITAKGNAENLASKGDPQPGTDEKSSILRGSVNIAGIETQLCNVSEDRIVEEINIKGMKLKIVQDGNADVKTNVRGHIARAQTSNILAEMGGDSHMIEFEILMYSDAKFYSIQRQSDVLASVSCKSSLNMKLRGCDIIYDQTKVLDISQYAVQRILGPINVFTAALDESAEDLPANVVSMGLDVEMTESIVTVPGMDSGRLKQERSLVLNFDSVSVYSEKPSKEDNMVWDVLGIDVKNVASEVKLGADKKVSLIEKAFNLHPSIRLARERNITKVSLSLPSIIMKLSAEKMALIQHILTTNLAASEFEGLVSPEVASANKLLFDKWTEGVETSEVVVSVGMSDHAKLRVNLLESTSGDMFGRIEVGHFGFTRRQTPANDCILNQSVDLDDIEIFQVDHVQAEMSLLRKSTSRPDPMIGLFIEEYSDDSLVKLNLEEMFVDLDIPFMLRLVNVFSAVEPDEHCQNESAVDLRDVLYPPTTAAVYAPPHTTKFEISTKGIKVLIKEDDTSRSPQLQIQFNAAITGENGVHHLSAPATLFPSLKYTDHNSLLFLSEGIKEIHEEMHIVPKRDKLVLQRQDLTMALVLTDFTVNLRKPQQRISSTDVFFLTEPVITPVNGSGKITVSNQSWLSPKIFYECLRLRNVSQAEGAFESVNELHTSLRNAFIPLRNRKAYVEFAESLQVSLATSDLSIILRVLNTVQSSSTIEDSKETRSAAPARVQSHDEYPDIHPDDWEVVLPNASKYVDSVRRGTSSVILGSLHKDTPVWLKSLLSPGDSILFYSIDGHSEYNRITSVDEWNRVVVPAGNVRLKVRSHPDKIEFGFSCEATVFNDVVGQNAPFFKATIMSVMGTLSTNMDLIPSSGASVGSCSDRSGIDHPCIPPLFSAECQCRFDVALQVFNPFTSVYEYAIEPFTASTSLSALATDPIDILNAEESRRPSVFSKFEVWPCTGNQNDRLELNVGPALYGVLGELRALVYHQKCDSGSSGNMQSGSPDGLDGLDSVAAKRVSTSYCIRNETGVRMAFTTDTISSTFSADSLAVVEVPISGEVPFNASFSGRNGDEKKETYLQLFFDEHGSTSQKIALSYTGTISIPVHRKKDGKTVKSTVFLQAQLFEGVKVLTVRSKNQIQNFTEHMFDVVYPNDSGTYQQNILPPKATLGLSPFTRNEKVRIRPLSTESKQYSLSESISLDKELDASLTVKSEDMKGDMDIVVRVLTSISSYNVVRIGAPLHVSNLLPYTCEFRVKSEKGDIIENGSLLSSETREIFFIGEKTEIEYRLDKFQWSGSLRCGSFKSDGNSHKQEVYLEKRSVSGASGKAKPRKVESLRLETEGIWQGFDASSKARQLSLAVYSPYWIVDETTLGLTLGVIKGKGKSVATAAIQQGPVTEECFENQRYVMIKGWKGGNLLPTDPPKWSTADGRRRASPESIDPQLPEGWKWTDEWKLDTSGVKDDGWEYAMDFWKFNESRSRKPKAGMFDHARRRRWIRTREFIEETEEVDDASDEILEIADGESSTALSTAMSEQDAHSWFSKKCRKKISLFWTPTGKLRLRYGMGDWSDKFNIDEVGAKYSAEVVDPSEIRRRLSLLLMVDNAPAPFQRTKKVSITFAYWLVNRTQETLIMQQEGTERSIFPGTCLPLAVYEQVPYVSLRPESDDTSGSCRIPLSTVGDFPVELHSKAAGFEEYGFGKIPKRREILCVRVAENPEVPGQMLGIVSKSAPPDPRDADESLTSLDTHSSSLTLTLNNFTPYYILLSQKSISSSDKKCVRVCPPGSLLPFGYMGLLSHEKQVYPQLALAAAPRTESKDLEGLRFGDWSFIDVNTLGAVSFVEVLGESKSRFLAVVTQLSGTGSLSISIRSDKGIVRHLRNRKSVIRGGPLIRPAKFSDTKTRVVSGDSTDITEQIISDSFQGQEMNFRSASELAGAQPWIWKMQVNCKGIGISLIDHHPREIAYFGINDISIVVLADETSYDMRALARSIQLDDMKDDPYFPTVIGQTNEQGEASCGVSLVCHKLRHPTTHIFKKIEARIEPLHVQVTYDFISGVTKMLAVASEAIKSYRPAYPILKERQRLCSRSLNLVKDRMLSEKHEFEAEEPVKTLAGETLQMATLGHSSQNLSAEDLVFVIGTDIDILKPPDQSYSSKKSRSDVEIASHIYSSLVRSFVSGDKTDLTLGVAPGQALGILWGVISRCGIAGTNDMDQAQAGTVLLQNSDEICQECSLPAFLIDGIMPSDRPEPCVDCYALGIDRLIESDAFSSKIYIVQMAVFPVSFTVSYVYSGHEKNDALTDISADVFSHMPMMVRKLLQSGITVKNAKLKLPEFSVENGYYSEDSLILEYSKKCQQSVGSPSLAKLIFSTNVLGNVGGHFTAVNDTLSQAIRDTSRGISQGNIGGVAGGLVLGGTRVAKDTVVGVGGIATDMLGLIGSEFGNLAGEKGSNIRRENNSNVAQGAYHGVKNIGTGIFKGVTGVFTKPIQGARSGGAAGFFKGVGQGLVGTVANPILGVSGGLNSIFEGASSSINKLTGGDANAIPDRLRPLPRPFKGWELRIDGYEPSEASIAHKSSRMTEGDVYFGCCGNPKQMLLVFTSKHAVIMSQEHKTKVISWGEVIETSVSSNPPSIVIETRKGPRIVVPCPRADPDTLSADVAQLRHDISNRPL